MTKETIGLWKVKLTTKFQKLGIQAIESEILDQTPQWGSQSSVGKLLY